MFSSDGIRCELPQRFLYLVIDFDTETVTVRKESPISIGVRVFPMRGDFHEKTLAAFCKKAVDVINQGYAWDWSEKTLRDMIANADRARKFLQLWAQNLRSPLPFDLHRVVRENPEGLLPPKVLYRAFEAADAYRQNRLGESAHSLMQYEGWDCDLSTMLRERVHNLAANLSNSPETILVKRSRGQGG